MNDRPTVCSFVVNLTQANLIGSNLNRTILQDAITHDAQFKAPEKLVEKQPKKSDKIAELSPKKSKEKRQKKEDKSEKVGEKKSQNEQDKPEKNIENKSDRLAENQKDNSEQSEKEAIQETEKKDE